MAAWAALLLALPVWAAGAPHARVTEKDIATFQDGLALAAKVQSELFPNGIDAIDGVLYDARSLYVYSHKKGLPLREIKLWHTYHVYRVPYSGKPTPRQWGGCRGGGASFVETGGLRGRLRRSYFECAPLGMFLKVQRAKRGSIYTTRDSYLATIVHEVAHQYQEELSVSERPAVLEALIAKIEPIVPGSSDLGDRSIKEAFATWCELAASEKRFPGHFQKLLDGKPKGLQEPHDIGMQAVREVWKAKH